MKQLLTLILIALFSFTLFAQTADPDKSEKQSTDKNSIILPEGALAKLSLQTPLSTKISEVGDEVSAILFEDVRTDDGVVLIAKGVPFLGRVSEVVRAKKGQKNSSLKLTFHTMFMPYGAEKISVTVLAIDDYSNDEKYRAKDSEGKVQGSRSGGRTAKNAGIGASMGSFGGLIGGLGGAIIGAGAGAVAGVLMSKGGDLKLDTGTILRIRFEKDLNLPVFETAQKGIRRVD
jgi:hypothetical protein